jgi:hypothetical protein
MANKWPDSHSFGAAAGLGWFGPPLIASDARMDLVSTLARAPDSWTGRFWPYSEDYLMRSVQNESRGMPNRFPSAHPANS